MPRIVVGVDGSATSRKALRWALGQAIAIGGLVEAVIAWEVPDSFGVGPTVRDGEDLAGTAHQRLADAISEVSAAFAGIPVQRQVLRGHPAEVILDRAKDADLLVVGSHGHGGFAGALLGSVSQSCVHHATCPVVVVRPD
ncbi:universal stress protein [Krasilnikovia sp. M28-CT-15]|uniref:universal stress protein n=1 Tax=Krasilnikovia sp. M28-CT-15 TaxID=3373540 RepID=UPI00399D36D6